MWGYRIDELARMTGDRSIPNMWGYLRTKIYRTQCSRSIPNMWGYHGLTLLHFHQ